MKCAENIKPMTSTATNRGDSIPHAGQNAIIVRMLDATPRPVAVGIMLGQ
jgi:hypothetical protein